MTENWTQERDRLLKLIAGIEAGEVTHVDQEGSLPLKPAGPGDVAAVRARLAALNGRLGTKEA